MAKDNTDILNPPWMKQVSPPVSGSSNINVGLTERIISISGGLLLGYLGVNNKKPLSFGNIALTLAGGFLLSRGTTGYCPVNEAIDRDTSQQKPSPINITSSFTINKPRKEVYHFWRHLENLPRFMKHLSSVKQKDWKRSHWKVNVPGGIGSLEWDADIIYEDENRKLVWCSVPNSDVDNSGEVRFDDAPGHRGTEVWMSINYRPPAGDIGKIAAKIFNPAFEQLIKEDLRRFKQIMEAGELPTIEGQPAARKKEPLIAQLTNQF